MAVEPQPKSPSAAAMQEIVQWSPELPPWQRDALRRLCQYDDLSEQDFGELAELCIGRYQMSEDGPSKTPEPLTISHIRTDAGGQIVALRKIKDITHVNALADNQVVKFNENGLTVVFGGNASGKSGYTRVLKKACRARAANAPILPNVYSPPPGEPATCTIEYSLSETVVPVKWTDGIPTDGALSAISVFDSACATVHVEKANDVAYTPSALGLLAQLADACREVKRSLTIKQQGLQAAIPPSLVNPKCNSQTEVGRLIASISDSSNVSAFERLADLTDEERERMETLRADLANDPRKLADQLHVAKQRLLQIISRVEALFGAIDDPASEKLKQVLADSMATVEAARLAAEELFNKEHLPNVGSDTWRALWEAARRYSESEAYRGEVFPVTRDAARCVLCLQELQAEASARLDRFENFVSENTQIMAQQAGLRVQSERQKIRLAKLTRTEQEDALALVRAESEETSLADQLRRFLIIARWRCRTLLRVSKPDGWSSLPALPVAPVAQLKSLTAKLEERTVDARNAANAEARRLLEGELQELDDRAWLSSALSDVRDEIRRRKKLSIVTSAITDTDTRGITTKSTALAEKLVTAALRDRFAQELNRLGMAKPRIELIQTTSEYGVPRFQVSLIASPSARVGAVLSEGEYRCIALAAFLSELATANDQSGIVLDDPVSSLDHDNRQVIAKRLVEESLNRQVIVFTHDIVFLAQLAEQARKVGTTPVYQSIARGEDRSGLCSSEPPMKVRPVVDALDGIDKLLKHVTPAYENGHIDEWWRQAKSIAGNLRDLWERAVEQSLSAVYSRFDYGVDTKGLIKVTVLTDTDCQVMRAAFRRCSVLQHSEASAVSSAPPTPDDLQKEIDELRNWMTDVLGRQDSVG
jgi:hypothetical protein